MRDIEIELAQDADETLVAETTELVNRVYTTAESGLWIEGTARTTPGELAELMAAGQIALARLAGQVVGSVRVQRLHSGEGELGMLVAAPHLRGAGIGRELVRFAERRGRDLGASVMQLELLMPRTWSHPVKDFLQAWYLRTGYREVRRSELHEALPHLAPQLTTPCDFVIFHKELTESGWPT